MHLKELESLVLRIASPKANKVRGGFARSENLHRVLRRAIKETHKAELDQLVPRKARRGGKARRLKVGRKRKDSSSEFGKYITSRMKLRWRFKGKTYRATARANGTIRFKGKVFNSPSVAASHVAKHPVGGWNCWEFERAPGDWVKLDVLRR